MNYGLSMLFLTSMATVVWAAGPVVLWESGPTGPDETVMVSGVDWGTQATVALATYAHADAGVPGATAQPPSEVRELVPMSMQEKSLLFVLPTAAEPALHTYTIRNETGATAPRFLNAPDIWWVQGDWGAEASPGGWLRVSGRGLDFDGKSKLTLVRDGTLVDLALDKQETWTLGAALPADIVAGKYEIWVHNGLGGPAGWRSAGTVAIQPHAYAWEGKPVFDVRDFGARTGNGGDDSHALRAALAAAQAAGGGTILLPRGRYQLSGSFDVPENTLLTGEGSGLSQIYWLDLDTPPEYLFRIHSGCGVRDLMLHTGHHLDGIVCDGGRDIVIQRIVMRLVRHQCSWELANEELLRRMQITGRRMLRIGNVENLRIEDNDFHATCFEGRGGAIGARYGYVARNRFTGGGGGGIASSDRFIYEDNTIDGHTTMVWPNIRNLYFGHNAIGKNFVNNREGMSFDGGTMLYAGPFESSAGTEMRIPRPANRWGADWRGCVMVAGGRGEGQVRSITGLSKDFRTLTLDRPWDIEPDAESHVAVGEYRYRVLFVHNRFEDNLGLQFYGLSNEGVIAGNTFRRCSLAVGLRAMGIGPQPRPIWHTMVVDNAILDGMTYRNGNFMPPAPAALALWGPSVPGGNLPHWNVFRGNRLTGDTRFHLFHDTADTLLENNTVAMSAQGYDFDARRGRGIVFRGNRAEDVTAPLSGDVAGVLLHPAEGALMTLTGTGPGLGAAAPAGWAALKRQLEELRSKPNDAAALASTRTIMAEALRQLAAVTNWLDAATMQGLTGLAPQYNASSLLEALQTGKRQGSIRLDYALYPWVPQETIAMQPVMFPGWESRLGRKQVDPEQGPRYFMFTVTVPETQAGGGLFSLPVEIELAGEGWTLGTTVAFRQTTASIDHWLVAGPFENLSRQRIDATVHPPELTFDIHAQYDTLDGRRGYLPVEAAIDRPGIVAGRTVDLAGLFTQTERAVAYGVAVVRTRRRMNVNFTNRSREPAVVTVNGQEIGTRWGRNTTGSVMLEAGDHLVRVFTCNSNQRAAWSFGVDIEVMDDDCAPGELLILTPDEIRRSPLFAEASATAAPALLAPDEGVTWTLILADDFNRSRVGDHWSGGTGLFAGGVGIEEGVLAPSSAGLQKILFAKPITLPLRVEFDAWRPSHAKTRMLGVFIHPDGMDDRKLWHGMTGNGYFLSLGWHDEFSNSILRNEERVVVQTGAAAPQLEPDRWYRITAMFIPPRCQLYVDGEKVLEYTDEQWVGGLDRLGLFNMPKHMFDNVRIYTGKKE